MTVTETDVLCYSRCGMLRNPLSSVAMSTEHRSFTGNRCFHMIEIFWREMIVCFLTLLKNCPYPFYLHGYKNLKSDSRDVTITESQLQYLFFTTYYWWFNFSTVKSNCLITRRITISVVVNTFKRDLQLPL